MTAKIICDMCGKETAEERRSEFSYIFIPLFALAYRDKKDLCYKCSNEILKFIEKKKK